MSLNGDDSPDLAARGRVRWSAAFGYRWVVPRSGAEEARQRELVLNLFLVGSLVIGSVAAGLVLLAIVFSDVPLSSLPGRLVIVAWLLACAQLLRWSRGARLRRASVGLVVLYAGTCVGVVATWSIVLPAALVLAAVLVVLIAVLLEGRSALMVGGAFLGSLAALDVMQGTGVLEVDYSWLSGPPIVADRALIFGLLLVLGGVSLGLRRNLATPINELVSHGSESSPLARLRTKDLTVREVEVAQLVSEGLQAKEIAERLFISTSTVNTHMRGALAKTGCANRTELAVLAIREGLAPLRTAAPSTTRLVDSAETGAIGRDEMG